MRNLPPRDQERANAHLKVQFRARCVAVRKAAVRVVPVDARVHLGVKVAAKRKA